MSKTKIDAHTLDRIKRGELSPEDVDGFDKSDYPSKRWGKFLFNTGNGLFTSKKIMTDDATILEYLVPEAEDMHEYLWETKYINMSNPEITELASEFKRKTREKLKPFYDKDQAVFDWLLDNMQPINMKKGDLLKQAKAEWKDANSDIKVNSKSWAQGIKLVEDYYVELAKSCYRYVRDKIKHSIDQEKSGEKCENITYISSDVLKYGTGICHAKANLLAALLRSCNIPAGICYQQLTLGDDPSDGYCLHAFNAAYVNGKWIAMDARGNRKRSNGSMIDADFSLDKPKLAFEVRPEYNEYYVPWIYAVADKATMHMLRDAHSIDDVRAGLKALREGL